MGISVTLNADASEALKKIHEKDKKKRSRDDLASLYVLKGAKRQAALDKWNKANPKPTTGKKKSSSSKEKKSAPSAKKKAKAGGKKKAKKAKDEVVVIDDSTGDVVLPEDGETVNISE